MKKKKSRPNSARARKHHFEYSPLNQQLPSWALLFLFKKNEIMKYIYVTNSLYTSIDFYPHEGNSHRAVSIISHNWRVNWGLEWNSWGTKSSVSSLEEELPPHTIISLFLTIRPPPASQNTRSLFHKTLTKARNQNIMHQSFMCFSWDAKVLNRVPATDSDKTSQAL